MTGTPIIDGERSYVAGRWVDGERSFAVENPADETTLAEAGVTPLPEVQRAIAEARRSFDDGVWADVPAPERARVLHALLDHVEAGQDALIATIMAEAGQPRFMAESAQVTMGLTLGRQTIDLYLGMAHEEANPVPVDDLVRGRVALSIRRHEPIGVVSAITPYNGAIIMAFQKLIPALMAGNSVILRPSPAHPAVLAGLRRRRRRRGPAGGRPERRDRGRRRRRRAADLRSCRRHGVVHGLDGRRQADPRPGGPDGEAGVARAGRQVRADLPRRRRRTGPRAAPWPPSP